MIDKKPQEFLPALRPAKSKSFASLIDGITLSVAAILIIVIFMMYLTEVSFNGNIDWKNVGFSGALMYVCTVSFYFLLRSFSSRKGRLTQNHLKHGKMRRSTARDRTSLPMQALRSCSSKKSTVNIRRRNSRRSSRT